MLGNMDRFKVGDKVYSKRGHTGDELGTVAALEKGRIIVRQFSNNIKEDYDPNELLTHDDHMRLINEELASIPKNEFEDWNK
jgi:hypothetical protein